MSTPTPGPWDIIDQYIIAADESVICQWESYTEEPNARLIAAAPDLLAALKGIVAGVNDAHDSRPLIRAAEVRAARAAIAKAEGTS